MWRQTGNVWSQNKGPAWRVHSLLKLGRENPSCRCAMYVMYALVTNHTTVLCSSMWRLAFLLQTPSVTSQTDARPLDAGMDTSGKHKQIPQNSDLWRRKLVACGLLQTKSMIRPTIPSPRNTSSKQESNADHTLCAMFCLWAYTERHYSTLSAGGSHV